MVSPSPLPPDPVTPALIRAPPRRAPGRGFPPSAGFRQQARSAGPFPAPAAAPGGHRLRLRADCTRCSGLCCAAPAFTASADFAISKAAGQACPNLRQDFRCSIHDRLRERGFPGCAVYDCFGAGQQVAQVTFGGQDWRRTPGIAEQMFGAFSIVRRSSRPGGAAAGTLEGRVAGQGPVMAVLRAVARPMLASIFAVQGFDTWCHPERVSPVAEPVVRPVADRVPVVPDNTEQAVRINGAVQFAAASMLALGRWPRLSALVLAVTLVPTTLAGHRFWEAKDEQERAQQRIHFLKNLTMLGGLLIAAADTAGTPSLAWRGRHAARSARRDLTLAARTARVSGRTAAKATRLSSRLHVG